MHVLVVLLSFGSPMLAWAQSVELPNFRDQTERAAEPQLTGRERIRFLTSTDYPPFNFLDQAGRLTGFNVDLVRSICDELRISPLCQIEARPFDQLPKALADGEGDAIAAGIAISADSRSRFAFTRPFLQYPARFVVRRGSSLSTQLDTGLREIKLGAVAGSAHEAMLRAFFPNSVLVDFDTRDNALAALQSGAIEGFFGDGVGLSFWLASEAAADCCMFAGGAYLSDRFLGEGLAIAVRRDDEELADAFDYAINRIVANGRMAEIMLRYFPVSAF
ncbi:transporter substrate-binding domain-containing protein [Aureimonas jatrophae]|uniref:Amino acid ABC transporter substrate-binding protein, PAAT family n=1 Tax=Aureimonas jatrophae TaxID=1166073 RepID=A0A1H0GR94_9HYPH|nr:transporter substrate-binding domain-containing protein [Aureimonas jatrophae]MBB3949720.1 polar amino acid transport system substrate-binding protein [Aureimonas jatrophae]SDO09370.1 amino acid ABC transporter substrate-binding protein, PAAT family [Aureimonas jatrophae]